MKRMSLAPRLLMPMVFPILLLSCDSDRGSKVNDEMKTVILPAGEVHEGWYFAAGQHVIIDGTVNGDLYAAAGKVDVNGSVNGDVLAAGGVVDIAGHVSDDVRAGGGTVRITGVVGKNVTAAGGTVEITRTAEVGGGVVVAGGTVQSAGVVKKSAMLACGNAELSGSIGGDADVSAGQLKVYQGAVIGGDLKVRVDKPEHVSIAAGTVKGKTDIKIKEEKEAPRVLGLTPFQVWFKVVWIGGLLLTGLVVFLVSRRLFEESGVILREKFMLTLLWGLVAVIGVPVVVIVLCLTLIGIPLGLILLAAYVTMLYLSQLSLGLLGGKLLLQGRSATPAALYGAFAAGTVIFQLLTLIPYLGGLLEFVAFLAGAGTIVILMRRRPAEVSL